MIFPETMRNMKFVFFGYDFSLGALARLVQDGHELLAVYTFPCDRQFSFNDRIKEFAKECGVEAIEGKITPEEIKSLIDQGCEAFIAFGYVYKIPPIDEKKAYAINVHPSFLPKARGIMPTPHILLNDPKAAGITIHQMTQEYDAGKILYQEPFHVDSTTDIEVLSCRTAISGEQILSAIMKNLPKYWKKAKKQNEKLATSYKVPSDEMRTLDWNKPVKELLKIGRAFGHYGCISFIDGEKVAVFSFNGWEEKHKIEPGTIACVLPYELVVACDNGFICLKDFIQLPQEMQGQSKTDDTDNIGG